MISRSSNQFEKSIKQSQAGFLLYRTSQVLLYAKSYHESPRGTKYKLKSHQLICPQDLFIVQHIMRHLSWGVCLGSCQLPVSVSKQKTMPTELRQFSPFSSCMGLRQKGCIPMRETGAIWSVLCAWLQQAPATQKAGDVGRAQRNFQGAADYSFSILRVLREYLFASSKVN